MAKVNLKSGKEKPFKKKKTKQHGTSHSASGPVKAFKKGKKNASSGKDTNSPAAIKSPNKNINEKNKKKFGKKSVSGNSAVRVAKTPKPKRLKKGPFKLKDASENQNHAKKGKGNKALESDFKNEVLVQSEESKQRIKKIRRNANENNPQRKTLRMIVKPGGKWFEDSEQAASSFRPADSELIKDIRTEMRKLSAQEVSGIRKTATDLYDNDCAAYRQACLQGEQKSDFQWMEKMMKVGTLPDKMAAYVVKIQDSPVHNIHHLQNLISMVKAQSKQQCLMAADTLKDLFLEDLLPANKKLQAFDKRQSSLSTGSRVQLVKWIFEDRLKLCYKSFIESLRRMSLDTVDKIRTKAVQIIFQLLTSHPEQEAELLQMLVNKLGDLSKKVGSRTLFHLNSLLRQHPRMKAIVIDEIERLLFRNNIAKRAQYYGICFLNTINIENEHPSIACRLIGVYIAFFKGCIKTGDIESRMMNALLTGVNKSYPKAKEYGFKFAENIDTLYKISHLSNFNISIQALSILFQLTDVDTRPTEADRYYRVLYQELLRPEMATTSHSLQFLNLIFKSMKCDNKINRVKGFCKRLLQICQSVQPNLACAILFLLSEVTKFHDEDLIDVGKLPPEEVEANEVIVPDSDEEDEEKNQRDIANLMKISNVKVGEEEDDSEVDEDTIKTEEVKEEDQEKGNELQPSKGPISIVDLNTSDIIIKDEDQDPVVEIKTEYKNKLNDYDPYARNPCYCGAEFSLSHEVITLMNHYHPSVALFAKELSRKKYIVYEGNPLKDFTVARFLERFSYKNAKKHKAGAPGFYQPKGLRSIPVNSADYLKNEEEQIPVEERFFYRYFKEKEQTKKNAKDEDFETDSIGDDEFDELMANYFKSSKKGKGLDEDDDEDDDLDFASEIYQQKPGKGKRKNREEDESEEEFEGEDDQEDEHGDGFGPDDDADEMLDLDDDDDDLDFHDEDGVEVFEADDYEQPTKKKKMTKGMDMFAPAEQFAEMLEANADIGLSGPNTLINRDNADPKQLQWEMDRDRWMKGYKRSSKTQFKNKRKNKFRK